VVCCNQLGVLLVRHQLDVYLSMGRVWGAGKGQAVINREGQREGKELRLYRTQSEDRTGGTRKIIFSKLRYPLFDRDKLINQL